MVPRSSSERSPKCLHNKISFLVKLSNAFSPSQPHFPFLLYLCYPRTALLSNAWTCKLCVKFYVLETSVKSRSQHKHFFEWFSLFRVNVQTSRSPPAMLHHHPDSSLTTTKVDGDMYIICSNGKDELTFAQHWPLPLGCLSNLVSILLWLTCQDDTLASTAKNHDSGPFSPITKFSALWTLCSNPRPLLNYKLSASQQIRMISITP